MGIIHFNDWENNYIPNILQEIYLQEIYKPFLIHQRDLTMLDVGSNLSLWSFYASKYAKQIYAFEPTLETYKLGLKNIDDNNIKNVKIFQKAIAKDDGQTTFYHSINTTMNSMNPSVGNTGEKEIVETIRLDTFVQNQKLEKIDFIKLDVEGSEAEILMGEGFMKIAPIVDTLVYEHHTWAGANSNLINTCLLDLGFTHIKKLNSDATVFAATKT